MSGGGGSTQTTTQHYEPPSWAASKYPEYVDRAYDISNVYGTSQNLVYGNQGQPMVAQMSDLQNKAANATYGMASQGNPNDNLSSGYLANLLNGGQQNRQPDNPYLGAQSSYGGNSPQFENMLNASNRNITDSFMRGTAAPQAAAAAHAHAYGGSGDQEMQGILGQSLGNQIAQNTDSMRNDQYNRSAQLEQADLGRNSGLAQNSIQNAWQGYENAANRGLQGINAVNNQDAMDMARWGSVGGFGNLQQQTQQANINAARGLFNENVRQPLDALDILGKALGASSGQGVQTTSQSSPGSNGFMNAAGGIMSILPFLGLL